MSDQIKTPEKPKENKQVSKCCKATFHTETSNESTAYYVCDKCLKACDPENLTAGRPSITEQDKDDIIRKLEPYLKMGLSINKSCLQSGVPKSTVFDLISEDAAFAERIRVLQQHISVMFSDTATRIITQVFEKAKINGKISKPELEFAKWYGMTARGTKEEFSERKEVGFVDPEAEIKRLANLIDSAAEKKEET